MISSIVGIEEGSEADSDGSDGEGTKIKGVGRSGKGSREGFVASDSEGTARREAGAIVAGAGIVGCASFLTRRGWSKTRGWPMLG